MNQKQSAPIFGIGTDIIEIGRIRDALLRHGERFIQRLFTAKEREYCQRYADPTPHFAGRFAAKEAIVKALGTGMQFEMTWHDIEIINDSLGKPCVIISEKLVKIFPNTHFFLSISHCNEYATATAILVG